MRVPKYERAMLEQVAREAGVWAQSEALERFVDAVYERLEKGRVEYGENAFSGRSFLELLREIAEEGADTAAWSLLASQRLQDERWLSGDDAAEIQSALISAAAAGLESWIALEQARYRFREARSRAKWREHARQPISLYFEE